MGDYDYCKKHSVSFLMPDLLMCPYCAREALDKGEVAEPYGDALREWAQEKEEALTAAEKKYGEAIALLRILREKAVDPVRWIDAVLACDKLFIEYDKKV